ncbi:MAG: signal peptidase I, partial [Patescibacteria group bacterium]|nr:signal peptidase I [Patescibacteria group bacterium]
EGFVLKEPYLDPADFGGASGTSFELGDDQYFVLGDNRKVSSDSRIWGVLPRSDIVGRVLLRLYPLNEIDILPGEARY